MPKYNYDKCKEIAIICKTRKEIAENYPSIYNTISRNKWIELFSHMKRLRSDKLTYDECKEVALTCQTRKEMLKNHPSMYNVIRKNGWIELFSHMKKLRRDKLSYDECRETSLKYKMLKDFYNENHSMYIIMLMNGWAKELTKHMIRSGSKYKRCIYAYEFSNNNVYIGLTFNVELRDKQHRNQADSSVFKFSKINRIEIPEPIKLTDYIDRQVASKLETDFLKKYKNQGWSIINIAKTGNLGGNKNGVYYTKDICMKLAKQFSQITDFSNKYSRAYAIIRQNNWTDEAFSHMRKKNHSTCKRVAKLDNDNKVVNEYYSTFEATKKNNISSGHICACCNGKRNSAGGYKWKYL